MSRIYISPKAPEPLKEYLKNTEIPTIEVTPAPKVSPHIGHHPDITHCQLGDMVYHGNPNLLSEKYPGDVLYNGCCTGKYFIHNLKYTHSDLLACTKRAAMTLIDVPQGYCRCTILPIDEDSIITSDRGSASICEKAGLNVLVIGQGHILLPGFKYGFIGGCGGRIGDTVVFNGDLSAHPDFLKIVKFIEERNLKVKYFQEFPLTDIGSILIERTAD